MTTTQHPRLGKKFVDQVTVRNELTILNCMQETSRPVTINELAQLTNIPVEQVSRTLRDLNKVCVIKQDDQWLLKPIATKPTAIQIAIEAANQY